MRIEEIKNNLQSVLQELEEARVTGIAMADDPTSTTQAMAVQMDKVSRLESKRALLQAKLAEAEGQQSDERRMTQAADEDRVQMGAKAFKSSGDFFHAVARQKSSGDTRLAEYASIKSAATGQNLTTDADGGYLVPPEYASELLTFAQSASVIYPSVRHTPVSGNRLIENYVKQDTRGDTTSSLRGRSGVLAYWLAEAAQYTASMMKFGQIDTALTKLTGLAYATDEMLEDLPALGAILADGFRDEFAFKIDDAILNGSGTNMPKGVLNSGNNALVTVAKEAEQAAATVNLANIVKMYNALPASMRSEAVWYCNQDVETALIQMLMQTGTVSSDGESAVEKVAGNIGMPIFLPAGGLTDAPNGRLFGIPLHPVEQCAALGSVGDLVLMVPDAYRWIEKGGIKAQTSIHVRFDYDETAFKFTYRCNGYPLWQNKIAAYKGATARSPYVTLAARA